MWTTLSTCSKWICLFTLAIVMLSSASKVDSQDHIALSCCYNVSSRKMPRIKECFEQKPRRDCPRHAYLVTSRRGVKACISPDALWLKDKIEKGKVQCRPDVELNRTMDNHTV